MPITVACSSLSFCSTPLPHAIRRIGSMGFKWMDLGMLENWVHMNPSRLVADYDTCLQEVREACDLAGVRISSLNCAHDQTFGNPRDPAKLRMETRALCLFARDLGAVTVTLQTGPIAPEQTYESALTAATHTLKDLVAIGSELGVPLSYEPHIGNLCGEPDRALELLNAVPGLKVAYDPSHFVSSGIGLEASAPLFDHTIHVHVRDAAPDQMQAPWGTGGVSLEWIRKQLHRIAYNGFIAIETIGMDEKPEEITAVRDALLHECGCVMDRPC